MREIIKMKLQFSYLGLSYITCRISWHGMVANYQSSQIRPTADPDRPPTRLGGRRARLAPVGPDSSEGFAWYIKGDGL